NEQLRHLVVGKSDRMKHNEPVNSVRWNQNVFPDYLQCRPAISKFLRLLFVLIDLSVVTGEGDVVRKGVEPDVSNELFIEWKFDSPIEARFWTRNAKIAAQSLNRVAQFILTNIWDD